jgi:hypothetical protein
MYLTGGYFLSADVADPSNAAKWWRYRHEGTILYLDNNVGNARMSLTTGGNMTILGAFVAGGNVTAMSDRRLKTDLRVASLGVDDLLSITPYTYRRVDTGDIQVGVVAQDVEKILPLAVSQVGVDEDGPFLSVDYGRLATVAVFALAKTLRERGVI